MSPLVNPQQWNFYRLLILIVNLSKRHLDRFRSYRFTRARIWSNSYTLAYGAYIQNFRSVLISGRWYIFSFSPAAVTSGHCAIPLRHALVVGRLSQAIPLRLGKNEEQLFAAATTDMFPQFTCPEPGTCSMSSSIRLRDRCRQQVAKRIFCDGRESRLLQTRTNGKRGMFGVVPAIEFTLA